MTQSEPQDTLDTIESCYHYLRGVFADFKNKEPNTALLLLYNKARRCEQLELDLKIEQKKVADLMALIEKNKNKWEFPP